MTTDYQQYAFKVASVRHGDRFRPVLRWSCSCCDAVLDHGFGVNAPPPDVAMKWATRAGWDAHLTNPAKVMCAKCKAEAKAKKATTMSDVKTKPVTTRELTNEERFKVRALLDKHFDDGQGAYLDGYSDQRIGEEAGVPWSLVAKLREVAYGPIRVDPEITALRVRLDEFGKNLEAARSNLETTIIGMQGQLDVLRLQIEALTKRRVA